MFRTLSQRIPPEYFDGFRKEQTSFIKNRVMFLCSITVILYFIAIVLDVIFDREGYLFLELGIGIVLASAGLVTLFLARRVKSLIGAKIIAYMFTVVLLFIIVSVGLDYPGIRLIRPAVYIFTFFLVAMSIPWMPMEVVPLWMMFSIAFTAEFMGLKGTSGEFPQTHYGNTLLLIFIAFFFCVSIRKKETERDIENFILFNEVKKKNDQSNRELEWARRVHMTIIPRSISTELVDVAVTYLPVYYIGGDYTRYVFPEDSKMTFIISDVTGHGVPAALMVNRLHSEFERIAKEGKEPGELMEELDNFIKGGFEGSEMYLTAFCGQLDMKKMKLLFTGCGHPPQYIFSSSTGNMTPMISRGGMLGLPVPVEGRHQSGVSIGAGDRIFLYTDGVTETMNSDREIYGRERLESFLREWGDLPGDKFRASLIKDLRLFAPGDFHDDICMLDIEIKRGSGPWHKFSLG